MTRGLGDRETGRVVEEGKGKREERNGKRRNGEE
jgi:hypothetical protein